MKGILEFALREAAEEITALRLEARIQLELAAKECERLWNEGITTPLGQLREARADDCAIAIRKLAAVKEKPSE